MEHTYVYYKTVHSLEWKAHLLHSYTVFQGIIVPILTYISFLLTPHFTATPPILVRFLPFVPYSVSLLLRIVCNFFLCNSHPHPKAYYKHKRVIFKANMGLNILQVPFQPCTDCLFATALRCLLPVSPAHTADGREPVIMDAREWTQACQEEQMICTKHLFDINMNKYISVLCFQRAHQMHHKTH